MEKDVVSPTITKWKIKKENGDSQILSEFDEKSPTLFIGKEIWSLPPPKKKP